MYQNTLSCEYYSQLAATENYSVATYPLPECALQLAA
jgi:hypothetical protein